MNNQKIIKYTLYYIRFVIFFISIIYICKQIDESDIVLNMIKDKELV